MMTDSIADMLTRIRNANSAGLPTAQIPHSRMKEDILKVLKAEGFISDIQVVGEGVRKALVVTIKYMDRTTRVLTGISRISTPGRRVYVGHEDMRTVRGGLGVTIMSTSRGIMSDHQARQQHLGGEAICKAW